MIRKLSAAVLAASFVLAGTVSEAEAATKVKLATLAPKRSPWGKVFTTWSKAVKKMTKGGVDVTWYWNGTAGPEKGVVGKIKSGQLHGAAITAVGLSAIYKPILALQFPGAFKTWADLDAARAKLAPDFEAAVKAENFMITGWGDVGIGRVMSKGFFVKHPNDLKGKKPAAIRDDIIAPKIYEVIGGVTPVPGSVTEFLPKLNSGEINVMNTPSLAAEQLQWASRLDHINTNATYFGIGAVVMSKKALNNLPADQRDILLKTGKKAAKALTRRIRKADDQAFDRLKKKMKVHDATQSEKDAWNKVFKAACGRLKGAIPGKVLSDIGAC